jgi:hypothetical protein
MSTKKHSFERRTDKLRASCDACYLAKVKCSKSRPLCQRCLVSGTNCSYSPSARFKRSPKTSEGDSLDAVAFQIQKNNEADIEPTTPIVHFGSPSYQCNNSFPDGRYPTPTSTPCLENWTPDLLLCPEPVFLFEGEAAPDACTEVGGFGLPDPCSWWNNTSPATSNLAESDLNDNYMRLQASGPTLPNCYCSWYLSPRSGPDYFRSNSLNMSSMPSSASGTFCQLDYGSFNASAELSNVHLSQLNESSDPLQYEPRGP